MTAPTPDPATFVLLRTGDGPARLLPAAEARISLFDRGFLFGDQIYEVLRTFRGAPLFFAEHAARLRASAGYLDLALDVADDQLLRWVRQAVAAVVAVRPGECQVRLLATRGEGDLSLTGAHGPPTWAIVARPLPLLPPALSADGCALATYPLPAHDTGAPDPRAKTGDKRLGILAETAARAAGAHEALRIRADGEVLEGATSTFFLVAGGEIRTPPLDVGILAGITREKALAAAREAGLPCREVRLHLHDLWTCDEAFITSTGRGILPVARIDGRPVGAGTPHAGRPGPVVARLAAEYERLMERSVAAVGEAG